MRRSSTKFKAALGGLTPVAAAALPMASAPAIATPTTVSTLIPPKGYSA
jgi:hypothetical protein